METVPDLLMAGTALDGVIEGGEQQVHGLHFIVWWRGGQRPKDWKEKLREYANREESELAMRDIALFSAAVGRHLGAGCVSITAEYYDDKKSGEEARWSHRAMWKDPKQR
tara:strand:- start:96 stop:425 length:330 start_codon:yes stop_codon:yes gene_type:complete